MNKSFSKIRHIQESNKKLERRFINETVEGQNAQAMLNQLNNEFQKNGIPTVRMEDIQNDKVELPTTWVLKEKEMENSIPPEKKQDVIQNKKQLKEKFKSTICSLIGEGKDIESELLQAKSDLLNAKKEGEKTPSDVNEQVETIIAAAGRMIPILGISAPLFMWIGAALVLLWIILKFLFGKGEVKYCTRRTVDYSY